MKRFKWKGHHTVLLGILALSAILNIYGLNRQGYGNEYYAAAVKSMLLNCHNFFFNSFDPGGFITIDKPPLGFWIQVLFARVFGFHGWALMLPQALAGVGSVAILYALVRRYFGIAAGLIAAAVMALTPIAVAVERTNQVDGTLVFVMLLATRCLFRALETKKWRWLLGVALVEGIGFNVKMLEAYLIVPAIYFVYAVASKMDWKQKLVHLAGMTAVLLAVSFSWAVVVDLTPADQRPYVGSSQTNSVMELIFGYNGIQRLTGGPRGGMHPGGAAPWNQSHGDQFAQRPRNQGTVAQDGRNWAQGPFTGANGFASSGERMTPGGPPSSGFGDPRTGFVWQDRGPGGNPPGGGMFGTGTPGLFRLFEPSLSGQIAWLLPIALLSAVRLLRGVRWRRPLRRRETAALYWTAWLLPMIAFFSAATFFHPYYLITLAPGIAALTGAGLTTLWRDFRAGGRRRWYLPAVILVDLALQYRIIWDYPALRGALIFGSAAAVLLSATILWRSSRFRGWKTAGAALGIASLLLAPGYWSLTPALYGVNATMPQAGPPRNGAFGEGSVPRADGGFSGGDMPSGFPPGGADGFGGGTPPDGFGRGMLGDNPALAAYLVNHYQTSPGSYLVATQNANTAAPLILETGLPVMAMGRRSPSTNCSS